MTGNGFISNTLRIRLEIFDLMVKLHKHGYHHFDSDNRNICLKDGKFRLIDLEDVKHPYVGYKVAPCAWKGDRQQLKMGGDVPFDTLPYHDLIVIGLNSQFWFCCRLLFVVLFYDC